MEETSLVTAQITYVSWSRRNLSRERRTQTEGVLEEGAEEDT